jgi:hypothetical protein
MTMTQTIDGDALAPPQFAGSVKSTANALLLPSVASVVLTELTPKVP